MSPGGLLLAAAIQELPAIIEGLRRLFTTDHPEVPAPTDAEVIEAFNAAYASSLAKDQAWLAAHPEPPPAPVGADDPGSDR
jgi:hypothetical protein